METSRSSLDAGDRNRIGRDYAFARIEMMEGTDLIGYSLQDVKDIEDDFHKSQLELLTSLSGSDTSSELKLSFRFEQIVKSIKHRLKNIEQKPVISSSGSSNMKLPRIIIKPFDSRIENWVSFIQLFDSLIHSKEIAPVEKLHYLLSNVQVIDIHKFDGSILVKKINDDVSDFDKKSGGNDVDELYGSCSDGDVKESPEPIKEENMDSNSLISEQFSKIHSQIERDKDTMHIDKGKGQGTKEVYYEVTDDFKCFLTEKRLKRHMPSHKKGPFKCEECNAEFTNINSLGSHRQRKHGPGPLYRCPQCPERFATLSRRAAHRAAAHAAPPPARQCRACGRRFLLAGNLNAHMRNKHLKVKRYFCTECDAGFFYKQELTAHVASHTGLKLYQCTVCPKRYPRKKALKVHMRIHTGERLFSCDACGKSFTQKCTLMSHVKTHNRKEAKQKNKNAPK
ncbi:zinc finger protein 181-like isoform X2 [Galleria mellonella]|uniref:Zinc finger protein 181-like isoform X2 n=1 Tax=Galleria mellonella TaxID=7137 RepID=A0ABM3N0Y6_GALME|nr:zinc finger protein 181-like isoform X2 [Galleria mellonella]